MSHVSTLSSPNVHLFWSEQLDGNLDNKPLSSNQICRNEHQKTFTTFRPKILSEMKPRSLSVLLVLMVCRCLSTSGLWITSRNNTTTSSNVNINANVSQSTGDETFRTPQASVTFIMNATGKLSLKPSAKLNSRLQFDVFERGVMILVCISTVFFIYLVYESYRIRSTLFVRRYGAGMRRNEMEMIPLRGNEEDEQVVFQVTEL